MNTDTNQIVVFKSSDGEVNFNVNVFNESVWLTQSQMAELFDRNTDTIGLHIRNIYKEGELLEKQLPRNPR